MDFAVILKEYWWVIALAFLGYLYIRKTNNNGWAGFNLKELAVFIEVGLVILGIYLIENYIFDEHNYFFYALPILIILMSIVIYLLLKGQDVYVLETSFEGQQFIDIRNNKKITVPATSHRLLVMDRSVYDAKTHVGQLNHQLWRGSDRIKFTDYYDDEAGIFHHPKISQLHNITFYAMKGFWIKMRDEIPRLIDENTIHTWLSNWKLAVKQRGMAEKFELHLAALERQHEHIPFAMPDSLEQIYEKASKEAMRAPGKDETPITEPPADSIDGGDSDG